MEDGEDGKLPVLVGGLWWQRSCTGDREGAPALQVVEGLSNDWNTYYQIADVDPYTLRQSPFYKLSVYAQRDADMVAGLQYQKDDLFSGPKISLPRNLPIDVIWLPCALLPDGNPNVKSPAIWKARSMTEVCEPQMMKRQERLMQAEVDRGREWMARC